LLGIGGGLGGGLGVGFGVGFEVGFGIGVGFGFGVGVGFRGGAEMKKAVTVREGRETVTAREVSNVRRFEEPDDPGVRRERWLIRG